MLPNPEKYLQQSHESDDDSGSSATAASWFLNKHTPSRGWPRNRTTPSHCGDAFSHPVTHTAAEDDAVELDVASMPLPEQERQAGKPDAITQAFVDGAAPLLSLTFDNQEAKNSAVEDLRKQQYWLVTKPLTLTLLSIIFIKRVVDFHFSFFRSPPKQWPDGEFRLNMFEYNESYQYIDFADF